MAVVAISDSILTNIADAIRSKNGTENTYKPAQMPDAIEAISGGGITPTGTISITENGTHDVTNYASANVAVSQGTTPTGTKQISITENGTITEDVTNYASAEITVNVSGGGSEDTFAGICNGTITSYESNALTRIPANTLRGITTLTSIKAPNLQDIGSYGLGGYRGSVVVMPEFTGAIYSTGFAFSGATTLTTVDIGTKITQLNANFFNGATNLDTLIIRKSTVPTLKNISAFTNTKFASGKACGTLYVPNDLISSYQSANNWSTILGYETNSIQAIEGSIYENAYADGTSIS